MEKIDYKTPASTARGLNGDFNPHGLEIVEGETDFYLSNVTSEGKPANGWITIPKDSDTIATLIKLLKA